MMMRILFLVFCMVGMYIPSVHAQVFLEQAKVNLDVSAGEHRDGTLLIHNTSAAAVNVKVYWEDFEYRAPYDGTKNFHPAGTAPGSASLWVTFSPQNFTLPAFGQQNINYTVTVPSVINEGHYGVLFFETSNAAELNHEEINVVSRIGSLFFIEPNNKSKKSEIKDVELKAQSITANFVNEGNVVLIPHTTYYLMQNGGLVLLRGDAKKLYVPIGATATIVIPLKKALTAGQYTLVINSDLSNGDVVVKEINLSVDQAGQITIESSQN